MNLKYLYLLIAFFLGLQSFKASATKRKRTYCYRGRRKVCNNSLRKHYKRQRTSHLRHADKWGKNYANTSFNVKIEYPEYEKLNAQEVLAIIANKKK